MKSYVLVFLILMSCNPFDRRSSEEKSMDAPMEALDDNTLLGPDKNNDGVRDDIEYWINNTKKIKNNNIRRAALLYAKSLRDGLKHHNDKEKSIHYTFLRQKYSDCLDLVVNGWTRDYVKIIEPIQKKMFNTKKRIKVQNSIDRNFDGQMVTVYKFAKEACPFELEDGNYRKRRGE